MWGVGLPRDGIACGQNCCRRLVCRYYNMYQDANDTTGFPAAVAAARAADLVVLVVGLDQSVEAESHDRSHLRLPGVQLQLVQAVTAVVTRSQRLAVVYINGGPVAEPWIDTHVPAVVEAWYPGERGGRAIADVRLCSGASPRSCVPRSPRVYDTLAVRGRLMVVCLLALLCTLCIYLCVYVCMYVCMCVCVCGGSWLVVGGGWCALPFRCCLAATTLVVDCPLRCTHPIMLTRRRTPT